MLWALFLWRILKSYFIDLKLDTSLLCSRGSKPRAVGQRTPHTVHLSILDGVSTASLVMRVVNPLTSDSCAEILPLGWRRAVHKGKVGARR